MSVRKKHVDPVRQREGAEIIQKSENGTGSEDLHRGTGVNQSANVSCTDISKRQNNGKFTVTLTIDPDVLESMLESTADDLLKVFHTSHEKNESEMNTKIRIKGELQYLTDSLLSAGGTEECTKQPHQTQSQAPELISKTSSASLASRPVEFQTGEPSTVTTNDQEVNKETLEPRVNSQIGNKRFPDSVDTSETPAKIPRIQTTKNTKRSLTKSVKKGKKQDEDSVSGGMQSFTPKSDKAMAGPLNSQKSLSDKKPTLETPGVPLGQQSGGKPRDRSTLQRRLIQKTLFPIGDKTNSTTPNKPSVHPKSQQSGRKRKQSPSMKTKQSSAGKKRVRCSKEEKDLCPSCSKPDCGKCNNCLNKSSHKACVEKPIEECRKYAQQSVSLDQSLKATTDTIIGTNSSLRDSHASEGSSSSTQPTQQAQCSPIQRLTNSETYSSSRGSHFSEDIDITTHVQPTQPSQQVPCSSEIEKELLNNSETNLSSGDNFSSQHDTIKQPQPTEQAPQSNEVHSELPTEVSEELPDTSATTRNSDSDSEEDFHSQIDKALTDVQVTILIAKCGVFGPPETGKSIFKALFSGKKKRPEKRQSTAIAEDAVQITNFNEELVEMRRTREGSNVRWFVTDDKKIALLVANTMYDHKNPINLSVDKKRRMTKTREKLLEDMTKLVKRNLKRNPKGLKGMRLIYLVDTGGQPQFQEILPMFVRSSSVHFLVHKLNESLDDCPQFNYEVDGVKYSVPEEMLVSNKVYLQQSIRTISSCNFSQSKGIRKPQFAVIGMFKDKCDDVEAKQRAVKECIRPFTESKKCVAISHSREKPIFTINGSEEGWHNNSDEIDRIHACIEEVTDNLKVKIPVRRFLFLNLLKDNAKSKPFLSLEACYKLAKDEDILMDAEDVDKALELFDELNLVLHFRKFLPNVVFVSPEFLLNKVTIILVQSFDCSSDETDITPEERVKFRQTGIIDTSTIKRVKSFEKDFHDPFKLDDLFTLLENLCIFAKVSNNLYFVPCVLALEQDGVNSKFLRKIIEEMRSNNVEPLVISFSDDYSPRGLFCATISYLSKRQNWEIESDSCTLERKRNLIEFNYLQEKEAVSLGSVVIVDRMTRFEVYSNCNPDHLRGIRRTVDKALDYAVINCLDYSLKKVDIGIGFECDIDCDMHKPHGTWIDLEDADNPRWLNKCIKNKSKHAKKLNEKQRPWFFSLESEVAGNIDSSKELSLSLLMDEVASETNKWELIAIKLKFKSVLIERIETEQRSILMCFQKVFTTWERQGNPPYTWQVIIDALDSRSVREHSLAKTLRRQYIHVA